MKAEQNKENLPSKPTNSTSTLGQDILKKLVGKVSKSLQLMAVTTCLIDGRDPKQAFASRPR